MVKLLYIDNYVSSFYKKILTKHFKTNNYTNKPNILVYSKDNNYKIYFINLLLIKLYGIKDTKTQVVSHKINRNRQIHYENSRCHSSIIINKKNYLVVHKIVNLIKHITSQNLFTTNVQYIVIHNVDQLPLLIQQGLRSIIEKTHHKFRYILTASYINKIDTPIKSRLFNLRLATPSQRKIFKFLNTICYTEKLPITREIINNIISRTECNIHRALLILQASFSTNSSLYIEYKDRTEIIILKIINVIINLSKISSILKIKKYIQIIYTKNMDIDRIFRDIGNILTKLEINNDMKVKIIQLAAKIQHNYVCGSRAIFHLEYFIFSLIQLFKERGV